MNRDPSLFFWGEERRRRRGKWGRMRSEEDRRDEEGEGGKDGPGWARMGGRRTRTREKMVGEGENSVRKIFSVCIHIPLPFHCLP